MKHPYTSFLKLNTKSSFRLNKFHLETRRQKLLIVIILELYIYIKCSYHSRIHGCFEKLSVCFHVCNSEHLLLRKQSCLFLTGRFFKFIPVLNLAVFIHSMSRNRSFSYSPWLLYTFTPSPTQLFHCSTVLLQLLAMVCTLQRQNATQNLC